MNKFQVILSLAAIVIVTGEPPVLSDGYGYNRPHHGGGGGLIIGGSGIGGSGIGGGHGFTSIGHGGGGYHTQEGQHVDPQLLHKIKEILLEHEQLENAHRAHHSISYVTGPSDSYGPPSHQYGPPAYHHHHENVVGIELGHVQPSIQVAHYHQAEHQYHHTAPGISYGVPSIGIPSGSYGPPPSVHIPSGSYGVPSDSYGVPHH